MIPAFVPLLIRALMLRVYVRVPDVKEYVVRKVAWALPRTVVYWCAIRLCADVTCKNGNIVVPDLLFMDALKRWEK